MRLSLYQGAARSRDKEGVLAIIERTLKGCAAHGSDAVLFPELFLTGYNIGADVKSLAEPIDGPSLKHLSDMARRYRQALIVGFPELSGGLVFNSAVVFDKDGSLLCVYRKVQLYGEREQTHFERGSEPKLFRLCGLNTSLLICYDVEFPEMVRPLAKAGVELILIPTANMKPFLHVSQILVPARALENGITLAYCNYCGSEGDLNYSGLSCIVGEDGSDLARAGGRGEAILTVDLSARIATSILKSTQLKDWHNGT